VSLLLLDPWLRLELLVLVGIPGPAMSARLLPGQCIPSRRYAAVPSPANPRRLTLWCRHDGDHWVPLPDHGLWAEEVPTGLSARGRAAWVARWHTTVSHALAADPIGVQARWSVVTDCCAYCGNPLTDDTSRKYGIDEPCREQPIGGHRVSRASRSLLLEYARAVARYAGLHERAMLDEEAIEQAVWALFDLPRLIFDGEGGSKVQRPRSSDPPLSLRGDRFKDMTHWSGLCRLVSQRGWVRREREDSVLDVPCLVRS
jgi:hypothetical protein